MDEKQRGDSLEDETLQGERDEPEPAIDSTGVPLSYISAFERGAGARLRGQPADSHTYKTPRQGEYWCQGWETTDQILKLATKAARSKEREPVSEIDDRTLAARRDRRDILRLRVEIVVAIGAIISAVFLWRQVEQQESDALIVRRAQLLETIAPGVAQRHALAALIEISPGVFLTGANLSNANLTNMDLTRVNLHYADLTNADLSYGKLVGTPLYNATLVGANLANANLADSHLVSANLTDADLTNANLTRALLTDAILSNANLTNADLRAASLHGADLATALITQEQINSTRGNAQTRLPGHLKRPAHWTIGPDSQ